MFFLRHRDLLGATKAREPTFRCRGHVGKLYRGIAMKSLPLKFVLVSGLIGLSLAGGAKAQSGDNDGCSNATLTGDYAFTVSGQIFVPNGPTIQREGIAMTHFDGAGNLSQVDFVLSSPNAVAPPGFSLPTDAVTGFNIQEKGAYTVYSDCTGTLTVNFPPATSHIGPIPGAVLVAKFVLSNGGRSIHTIVTSLTPPGAPGPIPALIRSEGHKLRPLPAN